ncbi:MAG: ion transporter [Bacteroidetes bacterium]|nr:MAG: ion transporter [Bacteroidota bacterium]
MTNLRKELYYIVFGTESKAGKTFDVFLLWTILFSVLVVMLESVPELGSRYSREFFILEWVLTVIFTLEFLLRLWISPKPVAYAKSFWGIIDFLSILPTYLSLFIVGYHYLLVVRIFRLLRVFRVLKLARFSSEAQVLVDALKSSLYKISIFLLAVVSIVTFMGTIMYVVEGGEEGFTSIPQSIYWAVVTVTTVGYGDMVPHTVLGKFISSIAMIMGYAIIAVPTGIVTVEMAKRSNATRECINCHKSVETESTYCRHCGVNLKA